ncbi:hypothetical protein NQ314_017286 [Rhamnusium bicolor]|uniref:DUF4806 domain-containing protein n=1 Tax=Rhamnusium bicolor TaxID=1586634 RepID=A0AAV8WTK7_9CUCU|nr:hypothetical protein NQ314_017286 [Rhamnusium bicolor]
MLMTLRENFDLELSRWLVCPINVKYRSSSYEKDKSKLKILEEQTNVSQTSDDADDVMNHTKNKKRKCFEWISKKTNNKIPAPPTLKYDNPKQDIRRADILKKSKSYLCSENEDISEPLVADTDTVNSKRRINKVETIKNVNKYFCSKSTAVEKVAPELAIINRVKSTINSNSSQFVKKVESLKSGNTHPEVNTIENKCTCKSQEVIIKEMLRKVENLCQKMDYLITINQAYANVDIAAGNFETDDFPTKTEEGLNKFNEELENKEIFFKNAINTKHCDTKCVTLQVVGGKDIEDSIRRLLGKIIDHELSLKCNWLGRNNKIPFVRYKNILALILVAVRKSPLGRNATEQDVASVTKLWLRSSCDRNGGRSKRKNQLEN